ncbi:hypothetical protein FHX52_2433 [Humibacillus xanthopallidus]|uniref:Uncharacterized protein n=1 Tax=Humibacillus xanthopallidus TaxID=412689 RepID=A0A543PNS8_9MICO|nr:hypothetical protein [Humibacillus xanthopallidus]TQN45733.1 hypothetical protein FHX52_2433 [Humibacillus xanthopallidus]
MIDSFAGRYDCPWDYTPGGLFRAKGETHRFPAPVHLRIDRVREERAFAQQALAASGRRTTRHVGAVAVAVLVLLAGLGVVYLTGIDSGVGSFTQLWALEAAVVVAVVAFVWVLRRSSTSHTRLAARAHLYEVRLTELHQQAQRERAHRGTPQPV